MKQKSQFRNQKRSDFFFKACIASCHSVLGRTADVRKNIGGGRWEPWAASDLEGPGGPVVSLWEITWVGIELGVSDGWLGIGTGNCEVWKVQVKMSMSQCRTPNHIKP